MGFKTKSNNCTIYNRNRINWRYTKQPTHSMATKTHVLCIFQSKTNILLHRQSQCYTYSIKADPNEAQQVQVNLSSLFTTPCSKKNLVAQNINDQYVSRHHDQTSTPRSFLHPFSRTPNHRQACLKSNAPTKDCQTLNWILLHCISLKSQNML